MGFKTSIADYGTDCPVGCWPAGKTPAIIYVSYTGILAGDDWTSSMRFPPTPLVPLPQVTSTTWWKALHPWVFGIELNASWTEFKITHATEGTVFEAKPLSSCVYQFDNEIIVPSGNEWYAGKAQAGWCSLGGSVSIQKLMSLVNIEPGPETYARFYRSDIDTIVNSITRKIDGTDILIKFDYS